MTNNKFEMAVELIDAANTEDPNLESSDGKELPKELLYSFRMSDMQQRYASEADDAMKLALRGSTLETNTRWTVKVITCGEPIFIASMLIRLLPYWLKPVMMKTSSSV